MAEASAPARSCSASDRRRPAGHRPPTGSVVQSARLGARFVQQKRRRGLLLAAVALAALLLCVACTFGDDGFEPRAGNAIDANARVTKVVDGDTIVVDTGGRELRVRMIGFDTPESVDPRRPVECFGKEASRHLAELAPPGTDVRLERDAEQEDRYGRTLAYVYRASDGVFLNERMLIDGYANVLSIAPNVAHAEQFRAAEREARAAGRGLWTACPVEPG